MTIAMQLDMSHVERAARALTLTDAEVLARLRKAVADRMALGQSEARRTARVDTGANRNATRGVMQPIVNGALGILGTSASYGPVMEAGRRPGAAMPPSGVLLGWMERHGIPPEAEFAIRRAIGRKGIKADHNLEQTRDSLIPDLAADLRRVLPEAIRVALETV